MKPTAIRAALDDDEARDALKMYPFPVFQTPCSSCERMCLLDESSKELMDRAVVVCGECVEILGSERETMTPEAERRFLIASDLLSRSN